MNILISNHYSALNNINLKPSLVYIIYIINFNLILFNTKV